LSEIKERKKDMAIIRTRVVAGCALIAALGLTGSAQAGSPPDVQACVQSQAALRACLPEAAQNPALAQALLANSTTVDTQSPPSTPTPGDPCVTDTDQHTIGLLGIDWGWQKLYVNYCYSFGRITSQDVFVVRWSGFPYCWKDTSQWWVWNHWPSWQDAYARGTLGGNYVVGCVGLQSDKVWIEYNANGFAWFH
jgi:hypothetical protein